MVETMDEVLKIALDAARCRLDAAGRARAGRGPRHHRRRDHALTRVAPPRGPTPQRRIADAAGGTWPGPRALVKVADVELLSERGQRRRPAAGRLAAGGVGRTLQRRQVEPDQRADAAAARRGRARRPARRGCSTSTGWRRRGFAPHGFYLVDLPGYGYARGGPPRPQGFDQLVGDYFALPPAGPGSAAGDAARPHAGRARRGCQAPWARRRLAARLVAGQTGPPAWSRWPRRSTNSRAPNASAPSATGRRR